MECFTNNKEKYTVVYKEFFLDCYKQSFFYFCLFVLLQLVPSTILFFFRNAPSLLFPTRKKIQNQIKIFYFEIFFFCIIFVSSLNNVSFFFLRFKSSKKLKKFFWNFTLNIDVTKCFWFDFSSPFLLSFLVIKKKINFHKSHYYKIREFFSFFFLNI